MSATFNSLQLDIAKIWRLKTQNVKVSYIVKQMKRNTPGIYEILSKGDNAIAKKHSGRPITTSQRKDRGILRAVSTPKKSVREIARILVFRISRSIVHHHIQVSKFHKYRRMCRTPMLKVKPWKGTRSLD